jgi:hypothetical protein
VPAPVDGGDLNAIEVGVKFTVDVPGLVTGVRFYKAEDNTGTHTGTLWNASGTALASATFSNESVVGWQTVTFASPVAVVPGTTYIVSYHTNQGDYSATSGWFASTWSDGPLHAPSDTVSGGNGVFIYGSSAFPTKSFGSSNYWVDVTFQPS